IRTGIGRAGAVLRLHPAGSTLPVMVLSGGAIAFLLFSTVSIRVLHGSPASPEAAASGPNPVATAGAVPITGSQGGVAGLGGSGHRQAIPPGLGGSSLATGPSLAGAGPNAAPGTGGNGTGQGGTGTSGSTGTGSRSSGGSGAGTTLTGGTDPAPAPAQGGTGGGTGSGGSSSAPASQAPAAPSSSAPQPAPSATHAASSGVCLKVGPLGVCLNV
ncbi:MAG TPA: hypothetical protein VH480_17590, partial [Streptosporangiaceae bacterium]